MDHTETAILDFPSPKPQDRPGDAEAPRVTILGVKITNVNRAQAVELLRHAMRQAERRTVCFVNAHTLNLATADPAYRQVLNAADYVFGDGTGIRWAARLRGIRMRDNVNGTDLVPALLQATGGHGYRCFLLGADPPSIDRAADYAAATFPGWSQAGCHHGFIRSEKATARVIRQINQSSDLLLVGMGNPLQEQWIHTHRGELEVPLCMAVGGLFDFWAGNVSRAPHLFRRLGHEWLWRLWQQPRDKARRYLLGNPLFLLRMLREQ